MKQRLVIACIAVLLSTSLNGNAFIVNTGPGPEGLPGFSLGGLQWVAVEFDVTPTTITERNNGWILAHRAGTLNLSLYSDGGEVPGELLFRSTGFVNSGTTASWQGLSSLNWTVEPGTYWLGFEPRSDGTVVRMEGACRFPASVRC